MFSPTKTLTQSIPILILLPQHVTTKVRGITNVFLQQGHTRYDDWVQVPKLHLIDLSLYECTTAVLAVSPFTSFHELGKYHLLVDEYAG